jgi:TonB family protein
VAFVRRAALLMAFAAAPLFAALPDEELRRGFLNLVYIEDLTYRLRYQRAVHGNMTLPAQPLLDPWGTPYRVEIDGDRLRIIGAGSDRKFQPESWTEAGQFGDLAIDVVVDDDRTIRSNHMWLKQLVPDGAQQHAAVNEALAATPEKPLDQVLTTPRLAAGFLVLLEDKTMLLGNPRSLGILRAETTAATMERLGAQLTKETSVRHADEWGTPLRVEFEADDSFRIVSAGADKTFDPESWSQPMIADLNDDQVYVSGRGLVRRFDRYELTRRTAVEAAARAEARAAANPPGPRTVDRAGVTAYVAGGDVQPPAVTKKADVPYPRELRKAKKLGLLVAEVLVDEAGKLRDVTVLLSPDPAFDRVTKETLAKWRFRPGTLNGKQVPVLVHMSIQFGTGGAR